MKIEVNSALQQPKIIEFLENLNHDSIKYKHDVIKGIRIYFDVETEMTNQEVIAFTKQSIKADPIGAALYFNVAVKS